MENTAGERIQKWDILKFALIFLVVLGHLVDLYTGKSENLRIMRFWIYTFHMPVFIFITGLFSKKNIDEKRYSNILSYLLIYFVTKMIISLSAVPYNEAFKFTVLSEKGVPWYAFVIFAFSLITIALSSLPKPYIFIFSIVLACMAGYDKSIGDYLMMSRIIVFYPFFFAGYWLDINKLSKFLSKNFIKIISVVYIALFSLTVYFKIGDIDYLSPLLSGRNPFSALSKNAGYGGLIRLGYYVLIFLFCFALISLTPDKLSRKGYIAKLGSRTLQVYMLHYCLVYLLLAFFDLEGFLDSTSYFMLVPVAVAITLFCSLKAFEKPVKYLTNPAVFKRK